MTAMGISSAAPVSGLPEGQGLPAQDIFAQLAADLASGGDLRALLQRFLEPVMQIAGAQAGAVRVLSAAGDRLQMVSHIGLPEAVAAAELSVDPACGVCGSAFSRAAIESVENLQHCLRHSHEAFFGDECQRVLAVPMTHRGLVLGLYNLFFVGEPALDASTLALLRAIGELLGLALNNARLEREHLRAAVASERQAMAAEVHDSVAQTLAFAKMRMPLLQESIAAHDDANALRYCSDVRQALSSAHTNLRQLLSDFRAPMDPQGLRHALRSSILAFAERTRVALEFDDQEPGLHLTALQESQVFHIVQEALANIAKHAAAQRAWLSIARSGDQVNVIVDDDGSGAVADAGAAQASHFGVQIMRQRAQRLGGHLEIVPRAGGGTRVHLVFPQSSPAAAAT
jgi:two-component system, NarL family, nitrate/nitrite sensor histidine kinase NarX